MAVDPKYDPQDMESLLFHKEFFELVEEEKDFAMEHVDSEQEYADMRATLLNIKVAMSDEEELVPTIGIKEKLMGEFGEQGSGKVVWLSSVGSALFPKEKKLYQMPAFQAGIAAMIIIAAVFFYWDNIPTTTDGSGEDMVKLEKDEGKMEQQKNQLTDGKDKEKEVNRKTSESGEVDIAGPKVNEREADLADVRSLDRETTGKKFNDASEVEKLLEKNESTEGLVIGGEIEETANVLAKVTSESVTTDPASTVSSDFFNGVPSEEVDDISIATSPSPVVVNDLAKTEEVATAGMGYGDESKADAYKVTLDSTTHYDIATNTRNQDDYSRADTASFYSNELAAGIFAGATGTTGTTNNLEDAETTTTATTTVPTDNDALAMSGERTTNSSGGVAKGEKADEAEIADEIAMVEADKKVDNARFKDVAKPKKEAAKSKTKFETMSTTEPGRDASGSTSTTFASGRLDSAPGVFAEIAEASRKSRPVSKDKALIEILHTAF
jgi:hypothetical protein